MGNWVNLEVTLMLTVSSSPTRVALNMPRFVIWPLIVPFVPSFPVLKSIVVANIAVGIAKATSANSTGPLIVIFP